MIKQVIPIAGEYTLHNSRSLNPHWSRLRDSASSADSDKEGIRLEVGGGKYPFDAATGTPQKAYLEFLCDPARSGHEGDDDGDHDEKRRRRSDDEPDTDKDSDKDKDKDDDNGDKHKHKHNDHDAGSSLRFISYRNEDDGQAGVLRLQWRTKYACEGQASHQPESAKGSWGLFTWFIIM